MEKRESFKPEIIIGVRIRIADNNERTKIKKKKQIITVF